MRTIALVLGLALLGLLAAPGRASAQCVICDPDPGPLYSMGITPDGATAPIAKSFTGGHTATFEVVNNGSQTNSIVLFCGGSGGVTCTGINPSTLVLANAETRTVTVTYSVGAPGTGGLTLVGEGSGDSQDQGSYTVPIKNISVSVTPDGAITFARSPSTGGHSEVFTVRNTGEIGDTYSLSCSASNLTCAGVSPASVALGAGASTSVTVSFSAGAAGTGTLQLTAASSFTSDAGSYSVPVVSYGVSVTPDGASTPARAANTGGYSEGFTVTNIGSASNTFSLSCSASGGVTCGSSLVGIQEIGPGVSVPVQLSYSVGAAGTGSLVLTASGTNANDAGSYSVPIVSYGVSVTPDGGSAPARAANTGGHSESFTVTNTGSADTFSFFCSGTGGVACGVVPSPMFLNQGAQTTVTMPYSVGAPGTGSLVLSAFGTGASDGGSYSVPIVSYGVSVTPDGATAMARPANTGGHSESFTVLNTGSALNTFSFSCSGTGGVTCGTVPGPVPLNGNGAQTTVAMPYSVGAVGTGTLTLTATGTGASDPGSYSIPITAPATATVTPDGTALSKAPSAAQSQLFTVTNTSSTSRVFTVTTACSGTGVSGCTVPADTLPSLAAGDSTTVTVSYQTTASGTGTVTLKAFHQGALLDSGFVQITVTTGGGGGGGGGGGNPPPPSTPPGAPTVSVLPHLEAKQDLARCAVGCFAATWAQGTVPYFSLDVPRNVTLAYHGDRVAPQPIIAVDVLPDTLVGVWPAEYRMRVKVGGSYMTFVNGDSVLRFQGTTGAVWQRLAGQFNAAGLTTGTVFPLEIEIGALINDSLVTTTVATQYLSVDETLSPIARGWTLAGIQQLYPQADGSMLLTEGDGSATWFRIAGGVLQAPVGDFSTLTAVGGTWVRAWPDSTKVTFNSAGLMTAVTDRWGVSTTVLHDASNRVSQILDPLNNAITLAYNANGLAAITDPFGRVTPVTVTPNRTLTAIQDPDGASTTFGYDGSLRLATITNRLGATTTLGYGPAGRIESSTAPAIAVFQSGTVSPVTQFQPWQTVALPTGSTGVTPAAPVPVNQVEARITEPGGAVTRFTVNRWGAPLVTTNALGEVTTITYNPAGQPVKAVAPGYGTAFDTTAYNASGLATFTKAAAGTPTTLLYGGWAQPVSVFGPGQDSLTFALGANGRVTSVKVGSQVRQQFTYDSFGRVLTVTDGEGVTAVTNSYPLTGTHRNLSQSTAPGNRVTTFGHDSFGRRSTVSAPTLPLQTTFYSVINRVDSVVVATSPATVTRIGYNNLFPLSTTDPKGQVYQTAYNALGWVTSETDPAGGVTSHAYSVDGDLRQTTTRRGQTVTVTYDALHRPLTQTGGSTRSFSYANNGFVVTGTSAASTQTSFLNLRGQADSVQTVLQGQTFVQRFGYTAAGLLDTVSVTGPGGMTFQGRKYLYDEAQGLLTGIRLGGALTQFATDGNANPTGITFPAGDTQQILRGVIQAPIRLTTTAPYVETVERWLGLDKAGRVTAHLNYPDADLGRFFQFDPLGRLIEGKDMQRPPSGGQTGCPEDPNAILCEDGSVPSEPTAEYSVVGTPAVYSFDAVGNRLDLGGSYTPGNRITQFNGCTYTTDLDGNVTSRSGGGCGPDATFFWSAEGELDSLHTGTTGVKYLYDAGGRLVVKRVNGVVQAVFLWQGDNLLAELDGTATVKRAEYSYYPGLDNLHAVVINNERLYAHADGLGNVIALTDETQGVRRVYAYDDWGNDAGTGGTLVAPNADRARWKGALWLGPELDLYYMRNRWYEPGTGRFLSEDPIGLQGGINPVVFTASDPINGRDELGLASTRRECYPFCNLHKPDGFLDPTPTLESDDSENSGGGSGGRPATGPIPEACKAALKDLGISLLFDALGGGLRVFKGIQTLAAAARTEQAAFGLFRGARDFAVAGNGVLASSQFGNGFRLLATSNASRTAAELGIASGVLGTAGRVATDRPGVLGSAIEAGNTPNRSTLGQLVRAVPFLGSGVRLVFDVPAACARD